MTDQSPIYLDHHASTPVDQAVVDEMTPYFTDIFANPASEDHKYEIGRAHV